MAKSAPSIQGNGPAVAAAQQAAGTNVPGGAIDQTPCYVACVSRAAVCAVFAVCPQDQPFCDPSYTSLGEELRLVHVLFVLFSWFCASSKPLTGRCWQKAWCRGLQRANAGRQAPAHPGGGLAQTLGEVVRTSSGSFGAVLVGLQGWCSSSGNLEDFASTGSSVGRVSDRVCVRHLCTCRACCARAETQGSGAMTSVSVCTGTVGFAHQPAASMVEDSDSRTQPAVIQAANSDLDTGLS